MEKKFPSLVCTVPAYEDDGDCKAKGILTAHGMILLGSIPSSRRQLVKKNCKREIVPDAQVGNGKENNLDVIEPIILTVEKDSPTDSVGGLQGLTNAHLHASGDLMNQWHHLLNV